MSNYGYSEGIQEYIKSRTEKLPFWMIEGKWQVTYDESNKYCSSFVDCCVAPLPRPLSILKKHLSQALF